VQECIITVKSKTHTPFLMSTSLSFLINNLLISYEIITKRSGVTYYTQRFNSKTSTKN
jgi:hypothetical protein